VIIRCYLPSHSLAQVQRAFSPPHLVENAGTWDLVLSDMRDRRCDVAIVDPCADGDHLASGRLGTLAVAMPGIAPAPVVGYLSVTAGAMRAVQALVQLGASDIVIRGVDDSVDALATTVRRAVATCASARVVTAVGPPWDALPVPVASAIRMAFHRPEQLRSVTDLATAARTTRRSLDRCLARVGISPARTVLSCARVNAAFHLLTSGNVRVSEAAALVGYASSRSLTRDLFATTGCPASAIPARLSRDVFAAAVARRLVRRPRNEKTAVGSY
jgi:AraC-like DNA-binding protein